MRLSSAIFSNESLRFLQVISLIKGLSIRLRQVWGVPINRRGKNKMTVIITNEQDNLSKEITISPKRISSSSSIGSSASYIGKDNTSVALSLSRYSRFNSRIAYINQRKTQWWSVWWMRVDIPWFGPDCNSFCSSYKWYLPGCVHIQLLVPEPFLKRLLYHRKEFLLHRLLVHLGWFCLDTDGSITQLIFLAVLIFLSALFSSAETAFLSTILWNHFPKNQYQKRHNTGCNSHTSIAKCLCGHFCG